jgi:hypothetical protein
LAVIALTGAATASYAGSSRSASRRSHLSAGLFDFILELSNQFINAFQGTFANIRFASLAILTLYLLRFECLESLEKLTMASASRGPSGTRNSKGTDENE